MRSLNSNSPLVYLINSSKPSVFDAGSSGLTFIESSARASSAAPCSMKSKTFYRIWNTGPFFLALNDFEKLTEILFPLTVCQ